MNASAAPSISKSKSASKRSSGPRASVTKSGARPAAAKSAAYDAERLLTVLLAPVISEKGTYVADKHEQVIFRVAANATKPEVKAAVELMFKVDVESVQISNVRGKHKRFGRSMGRRRSWKKAYVSLKSGQEINFAQEA